MSTTVSIRMDEELLERLRQAARRERRSVNELIVDAVRERVLTTMAGISAREALGDRIGVVESSGGYDASRADEEFADALEARARDDRL